MSDEQFLLQEAKTRLAQASTYIPGCEPWLAVDKTAGSWVYDVTGSRYLDFGEGGRISLLGHNYISPIALVREHLDHYFYPGSPMDVVSAFSNRYAQELSDRFPAVDDCPRQVLVCSSIAEARTVMRQLAPDALEIRLISSSGPLDGGMVQDLVATARACGQLVVANETVSGFGRTGTFLACDQFNFTPDIVMLGPPGGGGLPFAALVAPAAVFGRVEDFGPVFCSPVSCAAACGVLSGMTQTLFDNVIAMGAVLERSVNEVIAQFPGFITELTGVGLLRQIHLTDPSRQEAFRLACRSRGLIIGSELDLTPPLTVAEEEVVAAADIVADVLLEWSTP